MIFTFLFFGCPLLNNVDGMGVQVYDNVDISMGDIYNVLKNYFFDFNIELEEIPESSSLMLFPPKGRIYVESHHIISMRSEKFFIIIQYLIDNTNTINSYATFPGFYIDYYLSGDNKFGEIDELKDPMSKIKNCLFSSFSELLTEDNFTERFQPLPIY